MTRASSARGNNNTAGHTHKKGKRGAPQTFARKLFNILHEGTPIVGWSEGGKSEVEDRCRLRRAPGCGAALEACTGFLFLVKAPISVL